MTNDSKNLIDQIYSEWDLVVKPFREAEKQYQLDLKNLILKHLSIRTSFDIVLRDSWDYLCEIRYSDKPKHYLGHTDVLENILAMHIDNLECEDYE
ncbi:hypothetical protein G6715_08780 [Polynucleobacter paneuropaeus]|nr:hypothetical protein [Polynucleobacter paneuropaeus]